MPDQSAATTLTVDHGEWSLTCASCRVKESAGRFPGSALNSAMIKARFALRNVGWMYNRQIGWLCPVCKTAHKNVM